MGVIAFLANLSLTKAANLILGRWDLTDVATCYKVFRRSVLEAIIPWQENRFGVDVELTAKIFATNLRYCEVPITYIRRDRAEGKKLTWKDGFRSVYVLGKYLFSAPKFCNENTCFIFSFHKERIFSKRDFEGTPNTPIKPRPYCASNSERP